MRRDEAVRTLRELAEQTLYSELVVQAAGHSWNVTPASLGMTANVEGAVARALAVADDLSLTSRVYHRLRDVPVNVSLDLRFDEHRGEVKAFVQQAFDEVAVPAVDARFALVDGELVTNRSHTGRDLAIGAATGQILEALGQRTDAVEVPVRTVEPSVTTAGLGHSIVVDLSENQLYLYDGLKVVADFPIATAAPDYTTPVGTWEVVDKRENPTWYNPAEDTWGADLPPEIEPGPGNPLGTRAIYLNAPASTGPTTRRRSARTRRTAASGCTSRIRRSCSTSSTWARASSSSPSRRPFLSLFLPGGAIHPLARALGPGYVDRVLRGDQRGDPAATAEYISLRSVPTPTSGFPPTPRRVPDLALVA
jgi:hypothetical protein